MVETSKIKRIRLHRAVDIAFSDMPMRMQNIKDIATPYLSGPPGGGKTKSCESKAKDLGMGFISRNMGMSRIEEFGGIPDFIRIEGELRTEWSIPELICQIREESKKRQVCVLLDDWHLANPNIQSLGYELFTDYSIKGYKIPENVLFILAGNDTTAAGARTQFSAVMNRVAKMYVETDFDHWKDSWAISNDVYVPILSFLDNMEYRDYFHGKEDVSDAWPSPRSWTNLSSKIKGLIQQNIWDDLTEYEQLCVCTSHVGIEAASDFYMYYTIFSKFPVKEIYTTGKYTIPSTAMDRFAFTYAISSEFINQMKQNKNKEVTKFYVAEKVYSSILKDFNKSHPELAMISMRYVTSKDGQCILNMAKNNMIPIGILKELSKKSTILA